MVIIIDIITKIISSLGYIGIFIPMVFDTSFVPMMSLITMPLAGFLTTQGDFNLLIVVLVGSIGNTTGAYLMHLIGTKISEKRVLYLIEKFGKYLLIEKNDYYNAKSFLTSGSIIKVFIGRFLPAVRNIMSLPAGVVGLDRMKFLLLSFLGSFIWCGFLAIMGAKLGENWILVKDNISKYEYVIYFIFIVLIVAFVIKRLRIKKTSSNH